MKKRLLLMMIACMAMSSAFGAVTWYLNESFETGQIPQDWTQEVLSSNVAYWTVEDTATVPAGAKYPATGFSSQYYVALRNLTGMDKHYVTRLITPPIDFVSSGAYLPILTFAHAQPGIAGDFDTLRVSYRPNANTPWVPIVEYSSRIDLWRTDTLDLPGYFSATEYQLAFEIIENMGRGVVLDDIRIKNTSFCTPASDLTVTIPGSTGVRLTWVGDLETDQFEVVVSEQPITDWDNYTAVYHGYSGEFFADVEGLSSATFYHAYVRAHCIDSEQDWTDWTSVTFETIMGAELPYTENFGPNLPALWTRGTSFSDARPSFSAGNTTSVDSSYAMVFSSISAGNYAYAAMPEIPVALSNVEVGFWGAAGTSVKTPSSNYSGRLYLGVMTNPNDVATFEVVDSVTLSVAHKHEYFTVPFQAYAGRGRFIAFMARDPEQNTTFNVDKVTVREVPTFTPTHVKVSKVTPDGFDIKANLNGATSMNIRVARAADYVHMNAVMPSSFLVSQNGISGNSYHVNAQLGDSIVAVYVQGVKNGVAGDWSFPVIVRIPVRASLPLTYNFNETDPTVSLLSLDKELRSTSKATAPAGVYFTPLEYAYYYPALSKATTKPVYSGAHLQLRGNDRWFALPYIDNLDNLGLSFRLAAASAGQSRVAVGVMTDPYDLSTFTQLATFDGGAATYVKCDVDLSEYEGTGHYVAIRAIAPATPQVSYGGSVNHIDDLTVQEIVGCRAPSRPKVTVTAFSATITWKANNMTSWKAVLYDAAGTTALDSMVVNSPSATFTNLQPETTYKYHLTTICSGETVPMEDKFAFTTPMAMPLVETFDELTQSFIIPTGWSNTEGTTTSLGYRWMYYANGYEGACVRFNSESNAAGNTNYLALPAVYLTRAAVLKFWWKNAQGGPAKVLISTDGGETRVKLDTLRQADDWVDYEIDLSTYTGQTVNIYFMSTSNANQAYHYLDELKIIDKPTCLHPQNLVISEIKGNSVRASWTPGGDETQWQYALVPQGQALDWANGVVVDSTHALISGLDALTTYELYVRGYCSASDQSEAIKKTFTTACGIVAIPFEETFTGLSSSNPIPECWDNSMGSMTSNSYKWSTYSSGYQGACLRFNSYNATNGQTNYLRSPDFNITSACKLSFMWKNPAGGAGEVFISQAGDTANLVSVLSSGLTGVSTWKEVSIDLTQYVGQTINIYFKGTSNYGYNDAYLYLDNVKITLIDVNCRGVSSVRATAASAATANVQWIAGGAQVVDIEVSDSANFGGATVYPAVTLNPFVITDLAENTTYYVRVRQTCDSLGEWIEDSFKTLCFPKDLDDLGLVTFNGDAEALDCWIVGYTDAGTTSSPTKPQVASSLSHGNYLYFSKSATSKSSSDTTYYADGLYAILPELTIDSVNNYEITFTAFKTTTSNTDMGRLEVGVITDPSDFATFTAVKTLTLDYAADSTQEKSYTVNFVNYTGDYNDDYGKYIMFRTQAGDSALKVGIDNVEIAPLSACPRIVEGVISNVEESSVTYSWEGNGATSYSVVVLPEIGNPNEAVGAVFTGETTADSIVVTGLTPASFYYAYVRANCDGSEGRWSAFTRFHTGCGLMTLPYNEGFELYSGGKYNDNIQPPLCWDGYSTSAYLPHVIESGSYKYVHSGQKALTFYGSGDNYAIMPEFEDPLNTMELRFWYQCESSTNGTLTVGYITAGIDSIAKAFVPLVTYQPTMTSTECVLDLDSLPDDAYRLVFKWTYSSQYSCCIDDISLTSTQGCFPLSSIKRSKVNRKGFTVTMIPMSGREPAGYDLVCSTVPLGEEALDTVAKIAVDSTGVYTFTTLVRETTYYVYARANCGDDEVSPWMSMSVRTTGLNSCDNQVEIGSEESTSTGLPDNTYYKYSLSQQIYTPEELEQVGNIASVALYNSGPTRVRTINVYLKHVTKNVFASTSDWVSYSAADRVYSGEFTFSADAWNTITFNQMFDYNGIDNIVLIIEDLTGSYETTSVSHGVFTTAAGNQALYKYQDDGAISIATMSGTISPKKNHAIFSFCYNLVACPAVTDITTTLKGDGTSEALISWTASQGDYVSGYDVLVSSAAVPDSAEIVPNYTNIQADSLLVQNLEADSTYYIYVRANCLTDGYSEWEHASFTMLGNCPAVDNLQSELVAANAVSVSWTPAYAGQDETFMYVFSTETLGDAALEEATHVAVNDTTAVLFTSLDYGQTYYIYVASVCGESHSMWRMTSITTEPICAPALALTVEEVYHNRVLLHWTPSAFSTALRWEAGTMDNDSSVVVVTDTTAMLIGLEADHEYVAYVRALCADGYESELTVMPFVTLSMPDECRTIGSGTSDDNLVPFNNYYRNAWTQTIYNAADINGSGEIKSIAFTCTAGYALADSVRIFMAHTPMSTVTASSWVPQADLVEVYTNYAFVHPANAGVVNIVLDTPFEYNGVDNLAIIISSKKASYSNSLKYAYTNASGDVTLYARSDSYSYYGDYPSVSGTTSTSRANIQICFDQSECPGVTRLLAKDITTTSATVSWEPMGQETSWNVYLSTVEVSNMSSVTPTLTSSFTHALTDLQPDGDYWFYVQPKCGGPWKSIHFITTALCPAPIQAQADLVESTSAEVSWVDEYSMGTGYMVAYGEAETFNVSDASTYQLITIEEGTTASLKNLTPETEYAFAVKAICSATLTSRFSEAGTFTTDCAENAVPWMEDFEGDVSCWRIANLQSTSSTYRPSLTTTASEVYQGSTALKMYAYRSSYTAADSAMVILPPVLLDTITVQDLNMRFYARTSSSSYSNYYDHLQVGVLDGLDLRSFTMVEDLQLTTTYAQYDVSFEDYAGTGKRIAILAVVDPTASTSSCYAYIDNIQVRKASSCRSPKNLTVQEVDGDSAVITWDGGEASQWQYVYGQMGFTPNWTNATTVMDETATLHGLTASTAYDFYVRSVCSATEIGDSVRLTFVSACGATPLPWSEGFESYTGAEATQNGVAPICWDVYSPDDNVLPHVISSGMSNAYIHGGANALTFHGSSNDYAVLPQFADTLNKLKISFWYRAESATYGSMKLGYIMPNDVNMNTFQEIATYSGITTMQQYEVMLAALPDDAYRLVFYWTNSHSTWYSACIDDVTVERHNTNCLGLTGLTVSSVSISGAQLEWNYVGGAQDAQVQVATDTRYVNIVDSGTVVNAASYYATGLQASTTYYARVRQSCGDGDYSTWVETTFSTGYGLPFAPTFSSTSFPDGWTRSNTSANQVFGGAQMVSTTSGWSLTSSWNTVISATHFKGNIYSSSWNYWVVTPAIDLTPNVGEGIMLTFEAALTDYDATTAPDQNGVDDRFLVAVSIDGGETWNAANVVEWNNNGTGDYVYNEVPVTGGEYTINMSDYAGHVVKIGFYGESTASNADNDFHFGKINLHKVPSITYTDTVCSGELFVGNGFTISADDMHVGLNAFSRYEQGTSGEKELTIQQVYMLPPANDTIRVELCEGEHYNDYGFDFTVTKSEVIRQRFLGGSVFGCDSMVYLYVTMLPTVYGEEYAGITEGESYTWHGKTFYQSTIATDTTSSAVTGCDSITTLYLTLCPLVEKNYHAAFCRGTVYEDEFFSGLTAAGIYETVKETEQGCQAHARIILRELAPGQDYVDSVEVKDLPYVFEDDTILLVTDQPGTRYHRQKDFGCGTVNVDVHVISKTALDNISAANLRIAPNPVAVGQDITILTDLVASSDYSCRVFDAVGKLVYETDMPSKTIPGLPTAGLYTVRISSGNTLYQGKLIVK